MERGTRWREHPNKRDSDLQNKIFKALGLSEADVEEKFGFFLRALEYGAPPHSGIALECGPCCCHDSWYIIINQEVIAFPKNRSAALSRKLLHL